MGETRSQLLWIGGGVAGLVLLVALVLSFTYRPPPPPAPAAARPEVADRLPELPEPAKPAPVPARLSVDPGQPIFLAPAGGEVRLELRLRNDGGMPVPIRTARLAGSGAFRLLASECGGIDLGPAQSCLVRIAYQPRIAGEEAGELLVLHEGDDRVLSVPLRGAAEAIAAAPLDPLAVERARLQWARAQSMMQRGPPPPPPEPPPLQPPRRSSQPDYGEGFPRISSSLPVDLSRTLAAGSVIDCVLENSIASSVPGNVQAQVFQHVYATKGRRIIIERGSKLLGHYESLQRQGQTRLVVIWDRIRRPDGAHILIHDQATDRMGRNGLIGDVDNRVWERIGVAVMTSVISGVVQGAAAFLAPSSAITVTQGLAGTLTTAENARAYALQQAAQNVAQNLGNTVNEVLKETVQTGPVITVAQGERFQVAPSIDLWLADPSSPGAAGALVPMQPAPAGPIPGAAAGPYVGPTPGQANAGPAQSGAKP